MGYSMGIHAKNSILEKKMLDFLNKNYRDYQTLLRNPGQPAYVSAPTDNLSYIHGKNVIGFEFGPSGDFEAEYNKTILRWIGIKIGKKKSNFKSDSIKTKLKKGCGVPYINYDGTDTWPIFIAENKKEKSKYPKDHQPYCVTSLGLRSDNIRYIEIGYDWYLIEKPILDKILKEIDEKLGDVSAHKDRRSYLNKRNKIVYKYTQHDIMNKLVPIRLEMNRLNDLWEAQNA